MFKNYLKVAVRNLSRYKAFSFINILGLAIGIACVMLILLFVQDELSYDRFHSKADRIYRVMTFYKNETDETSFAISEHKLGPLLKTDFPQIEEVVRVGQLNPAVRVGDKLFREKQFFIADVNFFRVFSFDLLNWTAPNPLAEPNSVVLSEDMAKKYFGDQNPLGKMITVQDTVALKVTAVMKNMPHNAHFHADFVCSMRTEKVFFNKMIFENWGELAVYTYVLLPAQVKPAAVEAGFNRFIQKNRDPNGPKYLRLALQPLTDIHLENYGYELEANGSMTNVYVFLSIAVAILFIAGINYMNLATARSAGRAKEVGVRKVVGASQSLLVQQFLTESVLITGIALGIALGLVKLGLPLLNSLSNKDLQMAYLLQWQAVLGCFGFALLLGVAAGSYPAFFLAAFQPIQVLKGSLSRSSGVRRGAFPLRETMVVVQFCISIGLIAGVITIHQQLKYIKQKQLGFAAEQIVTVPAPGRSLQRQYESLKNELKNVPNVVGVGMSSKQLLGKLSSNLSFSAEGVSPEISKNGIQVVVVDEEFFKTIGARMVEGREFSRNFPADRESSFILNEAAVKKFGWKTAVGKSFETQTASDKDEWVPKKGHVVGVVKDFHFEPLFSEIVPVVFYMSSNWVGNVALRLNGRDIPRTMESIQQVWSRFAPNQPFEPSFLDEKIGQLYRSQEQFGQLIGYFSVLAIFIACLGLFGLATFTAEQRTREIGIRKVLGASVGSVVGLLSKDFLKLVLLANLLAWPLAWWAVHQWLQDFAYRVNVSPWVFVLAGAAALMVALLTVSFQAVKAALANPIKSLRTE